MERKKLLQEIVNIRTIIIALVFILIGIVGMYFSSRITESHFQSFISTLGSTLLVTGLISISWELVGKRALENEMLEYIGVSKELLAAGIIQVATSFQSSAINWDNLFSKVSNIDLFFLGSSSWCTTHFEQLEYVANNPNSQIKVFMPDYKNIQLMTDLSNRMNSSIEKNQSRITSAIELFRKMACIHKNKNITIYLIEKAPLFSVFRLDEKAVVSFYSHREKLVKIPSLICLEKGNLYEYVLEEIKSCKERTKKENIIKL